LRFDTEHPAAGLEAIADLSTDRRAAGIGVAFIVQQRIDRSTGIGKQPPLVAARAAAGVETDIEAAPVVDRRHHRGRRLGVGPRRQVSREDGG
jgi:hypothetical protein